MTWRQTSISPWHPPVLWFPWSSYFCLISKASWRELSIYPKPLHWVVHKASRPQVIHFPFEEHFLHLSAGFERLSRSETFNGFVGSVDGRHIGVKPPTESTAGYPRRKLLRSGRVHWCVHWCVSLGQHMRRRVLKHGHVDFPQRETLHGVSASVKHPHDLFQTLSTNRLTLSLGVIHF